MEEHKLGKSYISLRAYLLENDIQKRANFLYNNTTMIRQELELNRSWYKENADHYVDTIEEYFEDDIKRAKTLHKWNAISQERLFKPTTVTVRLQIAEHLADDNLLCRSGHNVQSGFRRVNGIAQKDEACHPEIARPSKFIELRESSGYGGVLSMMEEGVLPWHGCRSWADLVLEEVSGSSISVIVGELYAGEADQDVPFHLCLLVDGTLAQLGFQRPEVMLLGEVWAELQFACFCLVVYHSCTLLDVNVVNGLLLVGGILGAWTQPLFVPESTWSGSCGLFLEPPTVVKITSSPQSFSNAIYRIPCNDCPQSYVGETGRTIATRVLEHDRNIRSHDLRKCDLSKLAYELGEVVPPESRIVDLKHLILNSQSYEEEFAKQLLETLIEDRERIEERERIEDRKRIEDRERIERERKEQMVMEFELEKLRIQTTRGNNDTSRSTSNDAHYEIRKLMPKYESKDNDLSFYLILFERQAKRLGLDEDQWAFSLLGLLPYEMTQLIARETEEQSGDYRFMKRLLLKRYKLSPEQFRQKFEKHERSQKGSWRDFAFELRGYFNEWIEGMNVENFDALKDLSFTNQLKKKVPNVLRNHLIDDWTKLNNPDELADKLDEFENVRTEMGPPHWNAKHLIPPSFQQKSARFPNQSEVKETKQGTNVSGQDAARNEISETCPNTLRRMVNRTIRNDKGEPKCFNCNQFGHIARDCPAPRTTPKEGLKVANLEVEGLETVPPDVYLKDVKIDNKETVKAMIDTGSSSCLMRESVARRISVDIEPDSTSLYGIGNQTAPAARTVGKTTVDLEIDGIVGREITVFIVNDDAQPYDLLIGRTWTDLPYVSFARIGKNLHIGYSSEFPFANLQEEIKSRRIELRATETVQLESDSINLTSAITDEVKDGYVLFTGVYDACVDSLLEVVDGKTTVPIISAGKGKLRVRKNQCVGRVELLNLDDIVVNLDVAEDSFQTKNEEKREGQDQMKRKRPILPEDINVNHSLTSKERQEILDVVNEYRDCFALGMEELGCTDVTKMDIKEVDGSKPVCLRPYKTTASEREAIREIVREWKDNGIVTETRSPYASPVLLVRKKTGDHRLVVDYRRLNIQTVKDKFPLPRIDDLLEGLRNAKFFTTLDLAHGYLQIPLTDKAKLKTAFITPDDTGQFERMIFGLANAPAEFQRLMHTVLGPLLNKNAFCYLDDVIIPAKDWREMIERLREVLERIRSAKLILKPSKCEFGRREVEFLGYVISTGGLKPGPRKIKAIEEFPEPKNVHDIRRFLGLTNFFRRFVKDFARKAEPLSRLTKKGSQFEWKEEQRRSFGGLRKDLVEYPVLAHYNPELKTEVHCDASAEGLAGMVLQMDEDCKWRLV
ncbi:hypothetical protein LAZ67_12003426 [Cordylochernes scorpioides]|uniref:Reverse transcriptase n=1 Tax=Cordylochernes scorpioides TaxID=51811 RepID=A0ABY6L490_9ARAC|nr:hypothetical protein LAZ67_12003426 [Cordylochernes scorpioides]